MSIIDNDEVGLKYSQKIPNLLFLIYLELHIQDAQGRYSLRERGRRCLSVA